MPTPGSRSASIREHRDRYRTELTDPAILDVVGDPAGLDVLGAGCGEGYVARELASRGARHVTGIDTSGEMIKAAEAARTPGTSFTSGSAGDLPFTAESFDMILANHLINDLPDSSSTVLAPGGPSSSNTSAGSRPCPFSNAWICRVRARITGDGTCSPPGTAARTASHSAGDGSASPP
jgi:SAM-dependent methyltransferase